MSAIRSLLPITLSLAVLAAPPALAERADRDKPVTIEADSARVDDVQKLAIYEGKVLLRQGTLSLSAERVDIRQDDAGFTFGTAIGSPVEFKQKMEGRDEYAQGWAERIEYDARQEVIRLVGGARLKKGEEELRGSVITYNAKNEYFQASGSLPGQSKGRVRAVLMPKGTGNAGKADADGKGAAAK